LDHDIAHAREQLEEVIPSLTQRDFVQHSPDKPLDLEPPLEVVEVKKLDSELPIVTSAPDPFLPSLPPTTTPETTILPDSSYPDIDDLDCPTLPQVNYKSVSDEISVCPDLDNNCSPSLPQTCPKIPEISPFPSCIAPSPSKKRYARLKVKFDTQIANIKNIPRKKLLIIPSKKIGRRANLNTNIVRKRSFTRYLFKSSRS